MSANRVSEEASERISTVKSEIDTNKAEQANEREMQAIEQIDAHITVYPTFQFHAVSVPNGQALGGEIEIEPFP